MGSGKDKENRLLFTLFKDYILQCLAWTAGIGAAGLLLSYGIQWLIHRYVPNLYLTYRTLYLAMVMLVVWVFCMMWLTYRLLKRVMAYVDELQNAATLLFDKDVDYIRLSPELGEISVKINSLKQEAEKNERLARETEQRKNDLMMYLAHDLKTPLSSVIGYLNLLRDEPQISGELREKYVNISLDKAQRLEDLINEFFEITRFQLSGITLQYSRINLTRLLEQLAFEFAPMLRERGQTCQIEAPSDLMIDCDGEKMQRVFGNLLRNAWIYGYENTGIQIRAFSREQQVTVEFSNRGDHLSKEKLDRIFDPFYRADAARGTSEGGAGLGLAIAKQIVELHGGSVFAESEGDRITFQVILPYIIGKS